MHYVTKHLQQGIESDNFRVLSQIFRGFADSLDQKFACHRYDRDTSGPTYQIANSLVEPDSEFAF